MRTKNKNHYHFVQKTRTGKFIAKVQRGNLFFCCSGFRYAKTAAEASALALRLFDKKKVLKEVQRAFNRLFKGKYKTLRFEPNYEMKPHRSVYRNGRYVEAATKEEVMAAIIAAWKKEEMQWWCKGCGEIYKTKVGQCTKCTGSAIEPIERILLKEEPQITPISRI